MRPLSAVLAVLLLSAPAAQAASAQRSKSAASQRSSQRSSKTSSKSTSKAAPQPAAKPAEEPASPPAQAPAQKSSDAPVEQAAPQQQAQQQQPGTQEPSLNFDLLEPAPAAEQAQATNPELEHKVHQRRTMLKLHQGLGLVMAAGLTTSVILGQIEFSNSFRGGGDTRALLPWHTGFVIGTSALFATVGLLGVLAPTPYPKEHKWDTVRFHKIFMTIATIGMLTQAVLGPLAVSKHGEVSEVRLATAHQVVGYVTLGAVAAGITVLTF